MELCTAAVQTDAADAAAAATAGASDFAFRWSLSITYQDNDRQAKSGNIKQAIMSVHSIECDLFQECKHTHTHSDTI